MNLGERLKKLRGDKTLIELSLELGILPSTLSNYENNYRVPNDENKKKIANYYNLSIDAIFFKD